MKIIIAGAGQVGVGLAKYLRAENHDIILIDNNVNRLGNLSELLDIQTIEPGVEFFLNSRSGVMYNVPFSTKSLR